MRQHCFTSCKTFSGSIPLVYYVVTRTSPVHIAVREGALEALKVDPFPESELLLQPSFTGLRIVWLAYTRARCTQSLSDLHDMFQSFMDRYIRELRRDNEHRTVSTKSDMEIDGGLREVQAVQHLNSSGGPP